MNALTLTFWTGIVIILAVAITLSIVSTRINVPVLGAVAAAPVLVGLVVHLVASPMFSIPPAIAGLIVLELLALGITVGSPLALFVLGLTESRSVRAGVHGGIVSQVAPRPRAVPTEGEANPPSDTVAADGAAAGAVGLVPEPRVQPGWRSSERHGAAVGSPDEVEILRGGATIGYLERIAVIGCLAAGRVEGIAVLVAIKGLGRFSELDSPEARERFIIGTLVSLLWACATGAMLVLTLS